MVKIVKSEGGFALLLVLIVTSTLSILLVVLSMSVNTTVKTASYFKKDVASLYLARGAVKRIAMELAPNKSLGENDRLARIKGEKLGKWVVDPYDWSVRKGEPEEGGEYIVCEVFPEDSKLPLSKMSKSMLEKLEGISPVIADAIVSKFKVAKGSGQGNSNEKSSTQLGVEDLLTVQGVKGVVYDGTEDKLGLKELLTEYSDGKIYVNGASKQVITAIPGVDMETASEIAKRVKDGKLFERVSELQHVLGVNPKIFKILKKWMKVTPSFYRIKASTVVNGVRRVSQGIAFIGKENVELIYLQGA